LGEEIRSELLSGTDGPSEKLDKTCALVDLSEDTDEDTDEEGEDDEEFNAPLKEPEIKTAANALKVAEDLLDFVTFIGNEDLSQALLHVSDILTDVRLAGQKQTYITNFFKPC
jgi:hypothetical protein